MDAILWILLAMLLIGIVIIIRRGFGPRPDYRRCYSVKGGEIYVCNGCRGIEETSCADEACVFCLCTGEDDPMLKDIYFDGDSDIRKEHI